MANIKQKITPFLWFDNEAEEAASYYVSVFRNSKVRKISRYPKSAEEVSGKKAGSVMTVEFEIDGMIFIALNGGKFPGFEFSPAISFNVDCKDQKEIDYIWEKLSSDPAAEQCGWCKDKFGITWQIVPVVLNEMLSDPDQTKVEKVTQAFLKMKKFDVAALKKAYKG